MSKFDRPAAIRYSITCLVALKRAQTQGDSSSFARDADSLITAFANRHFEAVTNLGDLGLLLNIASALEPRMAEDAMRRIGDAAAHRQLRGLTLQELSWILLGAVSLVRANIEEGPPIARDLFKLLRQNFLDDDSLIPRHSVRLYRRNLVSFGALSYFFKALHEYAECFRDEYAATLFRFGVQRLVAIQGRHGEWPWLISVRTGRAIDVYPVYSVHQDSMAMLFLLPALDAGYEGVRRAIETSYAWILGHNQLNHPMIVQEPFFRYRSMERTGPLQKPRRYIRSVAASLSPSALSGLSKRVRINKECRSYEMGWIVYSWAGRDETLAVVPRSIPIEFPSAGGA